MYSIFDYGGMLADEGRMQPYMSALQRAVKPDSVVLDIGTGTGIFALLACHYGARHVYAVETDASIEVARELAERNGFTRRITFIRDLSTRVTLPEKANIIISDLHGALPVYRQHLPAIIDACKRHLAPEGQLIPAREVLRADLVEAPGYYQRFTAPWDSGQFGFDMKPVLDRVINSLWKYRINKDSDTVVAGRSLTWATLDYYKLEHPDISGELVWELDRQATVHGIRVWFDTELAEGVGFSNAPDQPELIYGNVFFPFPVPVSVESGDTVSVRLHANLVGNDYTWNWNSTFFNSNNPEENKAEFRQSTFYGVPLLLDDLHKRNAAYKPVLNEEGVMHLQIMQRMKQGFSLEEIARQVCMQFPERYPDWKKALSDVADLSVRYSE